MPIQQMEYRRVVLYNSRTAIMQIQGQIEPRNDDVAEKSGQQVKCCSTQARHTTSACRATVIRVHNLYTTSHKPGRTVTRPTVQWKKKKSGLYSNYCAITGGEKVGYTGKGCQAGGPHLLHKGMQSADEYLTEA